MLIPGLMVVFSLIIFYIGNYLYRHQHRDFMLFKPSANPLLSSSLRIIGILLMTVSLLTLIAGISGNTPLIVTGLVLGIVSTTGTLLFLLKFL
ncbi:hypothetical protein ACWYVZ_03250 [Pediococcus acidilactici]